MTNIYVGNLLYATTEPELVEFFSQWGRVERATLVHDRETGRPRGFAFVEMPDAPDAAKAIAAAHGADLNGRPLTVNEARPRGSGGGGGGGGARPVQPARGAAEVQQSAGYGNRTQPSMTNPPPPPEDLPRDEPEASHPIPGVSDEPVRRSGGYTNHMQP